MYRSKSSTSLSHGYSTSSLNSVSTNISTTSCKLKLDNSQYFEDLKLLVQLLNGHGAKNGDILGRPFILLDFNNLTSTVLLQIVTVILEDLIDYKPMRKNSYFEDWEEFENQCIAHDSGIDDIYHILKDILPEHCEPLDYSVLLLPLQDIEKTRALLSNLAHLWIFSGQMYETFLTSFQDIQEAEMKRETLEIEIDDLETEFQSEIQMKENGKAQFPQLLKETKVLEMMVQRRQTIYANLTNLVKKKKEDYMSAQNKIQPLLKKIDSLKMEENLLKKQILPNPQEFLDRKASLLKQLEIASKTRTTSGDELKLLSSNVKKIETLSDRASSIINDFGNIVGNLENRKSDPLQWKKASTTSTRTTHKEIEEAQNELQKLDQQSRAKIAQTRRIRDRNAAGNHEINLQLKGCFTEFNELQAGINHQTNLKNQIIAKIKSTQEDIKTRKSKIKKCFNAVKVDLPRRRRESTIKAYETLEYVVSHLCHFPLPTDFEDDSTTSP